MYHVSYDSMTQVASTHDYVVDLSRNLRLISNYYHSPCSCYCINLIICLFYGYYRTLYSY